MKYDNDYLRTLYQNNSLSEFLALVNVDDVSDPRKKAIISTLKRSITVLDLEFNPIPIDSGQNKSKKVNHPHE